MEEEIEKLRKTIDGGFALIFLGLLFIAIGSCTEYSSHCEKCCIKESK
jgi:hypothetical protein